MKKLENCPEKKNAGQGATKSLYLTKFGEINLNKIGNREIIIAKLCRRRQIL